MIKHDNFPCVMLFIVYTYTKEVAVVAVIIMYESSESARLFDGFPEFRMRIADAFKLPSSNSNTNSVAFVSFIIIVY